MSESVSDAIESTARASGQDRSATPGEALRWPDDSKDRRDGAEATGAPQPVRALRTAVLAVWDHLFPAAASNIAWLGLTVATGFVVSILLSLAPPGVRTFLTYAATGVLAFAFAAGPAEVMKRCLAQEPVSVHEYVAGIRLRSVRYGLLGVVTLVVTLGCAGYFRWMLVTPALRYISPIALYGAVFWLLTLPYQFGLVTLENRTVREALKRSVLLVLDNPGYSLLSGIMSALVILTLTLLRAGIGFALVSVTTTLSLSITTEALKKYDGAESPEPGK